MNSFISTEIVNPSIGKLKYSLSPLRYLITTNPGKPLNVNMYKDGHKIKGAKKLPLTLEKSLSHLDKSKVLKDAFGKETINSYIKLKNIEIKKYNSSIEKKIGFKGSKKNSKSDIISQWEKDNTLDC